MIYKRVALALCSMLPAGSVGVRAQGLPVVVGGAQAASVLRFGTPVPLRTITAVTTSGKMLRVGQRIDLETTDPISLNGQVVIPVGSHAVAELTNVRNKGMWGKSGAVGAKLVWVSVNGRQIRLSGTFDSRGKTGTGGVVGAVAVLPVAGFFMTGTSARIKANTQVTGILDEDVPVVLATNVATPTNALVVPAPR